ncbi:MAG: peptidoglycan editing factor PgeF [Hyphomicrobiales bacterium]|nr:peptidoglycan editing factor PgeF [Hyphomicrobiales bacterium]
MTPPFLTSQALTVSGVSHGFFGREGGVSEGLYASLNCGLGSSDAREKVLENRARVAAALGVSRVVTAHQSHSAVAHIVERAPDDGAIIHADALATRVRGLAVGVLTADCSPVLLADSEAGVVAAAHAGWRGALGGVLEATVDAMVALGARVERIGAAVGPCIGPASYEVGPAFKADFLARAPQNEAFFMDGASGRPHFDLPAYVNARLRRCGVSHLAALNRCTATDESNFFSYRRSQWRGEPDYGRQMSAIFLR